MEYSGEYGIEISTFIPYIHHLKTQGKLEGKTITTYDGMQPYYFFMDPQQMKYKKERRQWIPSPARHWMPDHLKDEDEFFRIHNECDKEYDPPDYHKHYSHYKIEATKPLFIIQNKYNMEWGGPPINYISTDTLEKTLPHLCKKYKVIYIRSNDISLPEYSSDVNEMYKFEMTDKDMIRQKFPQVTLFEDLLAEYPKYNFNLLKCILFANAEYVLTVLGGAHFFSVCFPCKQIIHRCDRPDPSVYDDGIPYNLDKDVTTPDKYDRQWFQNTHDLLCKHHSRYDLIMTRSHEELNKLLLLC